MEKKFSPTPGIEPGPPGWKPGILAIRPRGILLWKSKKLEYNYVIWNQWTIIFTSLTIVCLDSVWILKKYFTWCGFWNELFLLMCVSLEIYMDAKSSIHSVFFVQNLVRIFWDSKGTIRYLLMIHKKIGTNIFRVCGKTW